MRTLLLLISISLVSCGYYGSSKNDSKQKQKAKTEYGTTNDKLLVYNMASKKVSKYLKSPSSSTFPSSREKRNHTTYLGENEFVINSWVDSQNSFGANMRTYYTVRVNYDKESKDISIGIPEFK